MQPDLDVLCATIRSLHRDHKFAVKSQSRIDRSMEAHIRVNVFGFSTFDEESERKRKSAAADKLIAQCRNGEAPEEFAAVAAIVNASDKSREVWDAVRKEKVKAMEKTVKALPCFEFVQATDGAGRLGFAQIVGECGNLSNYPNVAKVWKRLGLAPFEGHAGSTWKRPTWRPRTLTSEEWVANPFSGERYAVIAQIATWLVTKQVESKEKSGTKHGRARGPYGEIYVKRREHTDLVHPDWTDGHKRADALRITVKAYIADLWSAWRRAKLPVSAIERLPVASIASKEAEQEANKSVFSTVALPPAQIQSAA